MTIIRGLLCRGSFRDTWDHASDRCFHFFPCLSDPVRRSTLYLKLAAVMLHLIFVGVLFLFDTDFRENTRLDPCYVLDAMRTVNETDAILRTSVTSKQPASNKNGSVVITVDRNQSGRNFLGDNATSWTKLVMDMYPPGSSARTWTCSYCNVLQVVYLRGNSIMLLDWHLVHYIP